MNHKENNITDLSQYRAKKEKRENSGGYVINIQAEAARFGEKFSDLTK